MEHKTIEQLIEIIKNKGDYSLLSEKEFNLLMMSRTPVELLLMAQSMS